MTKLQKCMSVAAEATRKAYDQYFEMTGGYWLGSAPEYFLTVKLAEALHGGGLGPVSLEESRRDLMKGCGLHDGRARRHKSLREAGRCDIVLWKSSRPDGDDRPRAAIEVKCGVYMLRQIKADLDFQIRMLERAPQYEFGMLICQLLDAESNRKGTARDILRQRADAVRNHATAACAQRRISVRANRSPIYYADDEDAAGVLILGLSRSR